ncbi:MAG TPA: DUF4350 domain-containing protein, partial [Nitrospiria bacterium]|nr:DUF4350 domain-containing protein [Nitrospiria bacterium]
GITQYDTLVFESGSQSTQIKTPTEEGITNAIIRVSKDTPRKILFTTGHGEHGLEDSERNGYSTVRESLENQGFELGTISLFQLEDIPRDTSALIIAGPRKTFLPEEISMLRRFLAGGGRVMVMVDPNDPSGLEPILSEWGITFSGGLIIDTLSRLFGGDFTIPVVNAYPDHEITKNFSLATFFPLAQGMEFDTSRAAEFDFRPVAQTGGSSWAKFNIPEDGRIALDPETDKKGPFTIAATVAMKTKSGDGDVPAGEQEAQGTLAIFGDSDFTSNSSFHFSGNGDLFLNTVSWLAQEKNLISIRAQEPSFSPLFLSRTQGRVLMYVSLIILPTGILVIGFTVWKRRKRL